MKQTESAEDDIALLDRVARQRDEAAFSELFARYERPAYSIAFNIVGNARSAEEVVQEAMLRVWTNAERFRASDSETPNARAWIMKIITRESFMALRRRKKF